MDEARLRELFASVADGAPPAGFDAEDVVAAGRRAAARRRRARVAAGVVAVALLGLAGVGAAGLLPIGGQAGDGQRSVAAPRSPSSPLSSPSPETAGRAGAGVSGAPGAKGVPVAPRLERPGAAGAGCGGADPGLAAAVAAELPAAAAAPTAAVVDCVPGERGVAVTLPEGVLRVVLGPAGAPTYPNAFSATTRDGRVLTVSGADASQRLAIAVAGRR